MLKLRMFFVLPKLYFNANFANFFIKKRVHKYRKN